MSKELEALNYVWYHYYTEELDQDEVDEIEKNLNVVQDGLKRLESIDNANPSEALECLEKIGAEKLARGELIRNDNKLEPYIATIKQALLKAQEHNSINLLMQELDCKDFADLRKYARCGYERLNNFKGSKEFKIEIPESSLMDYNPVKNYLKWEDLEFKEDNEAKIKVRMGEHIYDLWYGSYKTGYGIFKQKCSLAGYEFDEDYDIDIFNDLHLERVEE